MVDKDEEGFSVDDLHAWKNNHDAMISEVRQKVWSSSIELLRSRKVSPSVARAIIALIEDRRTFWALFDAEFPDRVRISLDNLRADLSSLRRDCSMGGPLDNVIVALGQTIRHFFDAVEHIDLAKLKCDGGDPEWRAFELALSTLRKSIGYQITALARSYELPLQGEFASYQPQ